MLRFDDKVLDIPNVGPKYENLLKKLDITTIENLLYHFPFRYNDFSRTKNVDEVVVGDIVTINASLNSIKNIYTRSGKKLTKADISDNTGSLEAIWFNQHYLKRSLKPRNLYSFCGKIEDGGKKLTMISPEIEEGTHVHTGRLVPIYTETRGISSKWIRKRIYDILNHRVEIREFLPQEILIKNSFFDLEYALSMMHFPKNHDEAQKAKARFQFEELFLELLKVERKKSEWTKSTKGLKLKPMNKDIKDFIKNLPFKLTGDQKTAVEQIIKDMKRPQPMNRLVEGDVGTGKTVIAVVASYLCFLNGYKVLCMAPTEILANQHFFTFQRFLSHLKIKVAVLTGSTSNKAADAIRTADIVIGTHALLYEKTGFKGAALVIIDEQHRFGVEQRALLVKMNDDEFTPHLLSLTATPIPRTLALTLYGDLEISTLTETPHKKDITTWVVSENKRLKAFEWILGQKKQTFVVCPLIEESEYESMENVKSAKAEFDQLKNGIFKDVRTGLLHGKMKASEKDRVVKEFKEKNLDVLVSTPVIEVGVDIPEASIIVIESAERYGLASLHQLRGRVGRSDEKSYCLLFPSSGSRRAFSRLKYMETIDSGLKLSEIDMRLRGHGDIYGTQQHGFKEFKVADLSDLKMLEAAKSAAEDILPKLDMFPKLREKIDKIDAKFISNN